MTRWTALLGMWACTGSGTDDPSDTDVGDTDVPTDTDLPADTDVPTDTDLPGCEPAVTPAEGVIVTSSAAWQGLATPAGWSWRGVRYAAPPTGPLRWAPPAPPACETELQPALAWPSACPQWTDDDPPVQVGEEDCLKLNVWAPDGANDLPVMVFIHGGGNAAGSTSNQLGGADLYDGQDLAARVPAVVVTLQYRLGPLGFLALSELSAEGNAGNHGLRDQIAALEWVRDEIAAFGGDPGNVLLFGESAGARNTCSLLASPRAAGLFHGAILQSGSCREQTLATRESEGQDWLAGTPCGGAVDPLACARGLPVADVLGDEAPVIVSGLGLVPSVWGPAIDGDVLTASPHDVIAAGEHNAVPLIVGANADETAGWILTPIADEDYNPFVVAAIGGTFGLAAAQDALDVYPLEDFNSARDALIAITTDSQFVCPARQIARAAAENQTEPVFRYLYDHALSGLPYSLARAAHGVELPFVFQAMDRLLTYDPVPDDLVVEALMLEHWGGFAQDGVPGPAWTAYDPASDPYFTLSAEPAMGEGLRTARCDFWDSLQP